MSLVIRQIASTNAWLSPDILETLRTQHDGLFREALAVVRFPVFHRELVRWERLMARAAVEAVGVINRAIHTQTGTEPARIDGVG